MRKLQVIRRLNEFVRNFEDGSFDLQTISSLVSLIRYYRGFLSDGQFRNLIQIPIDVLDNDVEISNEEKFIRFGGYYSGNIRPTKDKYLSDLKVKFSNRGHELEDILNFTIYIHDNIDKLRYEIEFLLRNTEVVLRDDVKLLSYSNFKTSGNIFAQQIKNTMDSIQNSNISRITDDELELKYKIEVEGYDVALSFAGEDRSYVEEIAQLLRNRNIKVFYDYFEQDKLWGVDLYTHLSSVYKDKAKYCLMFISENYAKKAWTSHERLNAQARAFREQREYILPLRIDNTEIPGIPETIGYIDIKSHSLVEIADLLEKKLNNIIVK